MSAADPRTADAPLNILALEPWHAGSHKDFLDGLAARSRHRVHPHTLPGRFWKWRQTGSGLILGPRVLADPPPCDVIFASDFLNLPDFLALTRRIYGDVPAVLYFHENQLTYPLEASHKLDLAYRQANLSGAAAADQVWFNSAHHLDSFFRGLSDLLDACPDFAPREVAAAIREKSRVMPLGVDLAGLTPHFTGPPRNMPADAPLTILWNHRWEHDKNPEAFFEALLALDAGGHDFRLLVAGQRFGRAPAVFGAARRRLARHIDHWGYLEDRSAYAALLSRADLVVSLACHDFFGVSVVEAMHAGCLPLLAARLNYPNLVPARHHGDCLVDDTTDDGAVLARLAALCGDPATTRARTRQMDPSAWVQRYDWAHTAPAFDAAFHAIGEQTKQPAERNGGPQNQTPRATAP